MAENSKHVTWEGLQYYDSKIKQYVDDVVEKLNQSSATAEEIAEIKQRLEVVTQAATTNQADIQTLFKLDKRNGENIRELQTRIEYIATKEELAEATKSLPQILDDISELEAKVETDHITLENLRLALENIVTEEEIEGLIQELANVQQDVEELSKTAVDKDYVAEEIAKAQLSGGDVNLDNYYTKKEVDNLIPDVSNLATKEELEAVQNVAGSNSVKLFAVDEELFDIKKQLESIPTTYTTKDEVAEAVTQINENIQTIESTYVTNESLEQKNYVTEQHITENYITIQDAADTYVTNEKVTEVVTNEVETVVTEQIETKVTEIIEQKIETGEININADAINYDTWD